MTNIKRILDETYQNTLMTELPVTDLHTDNIQVIKALLGENPKDPLYGYILIFFQYQDKYFRITFHVHTPEQGSPHLSNKVETTEELILNYSTILKEYFPMYQPCRIARMAGWPHTALADLKEQDTDAYEFRKLIENIKAYSRSQRFCQKLAKTDRIALKINPIHKACPV